MKLEELQKKHPKFKDYIQQVNKLNLLRLGGEELRKEVSQFIKRRPDEDVSVYQHRLNSYTYTNVIAYVINEHTSRLHSSQLLTKYFDKSDNLDEQWAQFVANIDGRGTPQTTFIDHILAELLVHGTVYLYNTSYQVGEDFYPIVRLLPLETIIDWGRDDLGNLNYLKCQTVGDEQTVYTIFEPDRVQVYHVDNDTNEVTLETDIAYDYDTFGFPVIAVQADDSVAVIKNALPKVEQHLVMDSKLYDVLSFAYIQRTVKPLRNGAADIYQLPPDPNNPFALPPEFKTGNPYVLVAEQFNFVEMSGSIVPHLQAELDNIFEAILTTSNINNGINQNSTLQSGESKKIDFWKQEFFLKKVGNLLINIWQRILYRVAMHIGATPPEVHGFDSFSLRREEDFELLFNNPGVMAVLPVGIIQALVEQYSALLLPNMSPAELQVLLNTPTTSGIMPVNVVEAPVAELQPIKSDEEE